MFTLWPPKRAVFDAAVARSKGTEFEKYVLKEKEKEKEKDGIGSGGGKLKSHRDDERTFSSDAAERHIPLCSERVARERLAAVPSGSRAKEAETKGDALKKRTAYKPPSPIKKGKEVEEHEAESYVDKAPEKVVKGSVFCVCGSRYSTGQGHRTPSGNLSPTKIMLLTPPDSFGVVERGVYRSNALHPLHFPFVKNLNLRTAVMLSPEVPMRSVTNFFDDSGIKFLHLGHAWKPNLEELIKEGLELILDKANHPMMIMCT
ncbi:hypothetical protein HDU93_001299 [Gonapodya sp. JEL0774]|nr:hypothetical protein HDU93_001299 [Gonapodya sp. JEL0774]